MFTASTEHDSKTINKITYICFNRIFELVIEESVYSGCDSSSNESQTH